MIQDIKRIVAEFYGIPLIELESDRKTRQAARPRQIAYWLAREYTKFSYPSIGRCFNRDYTTIILGVRAVETRRQSEPRTIMALDELRRRLDAISHRGGRPLDGNDPGTGGQ